MNAKTLMLLGGVAVIGYVIYTQSKKKKYTPAQAKAYGAWATAGAPAIGVVNSADQVARAQALNQQFAALQAVNRSTNLFYHN